MSSVQPLVDAADVAALLRAVDGLCASRDWDGLVDLRHRCDEAAEMGKQLWSVSMHVDYRLALEAPAAWAGPVVRPGAARFALGPLTEVVAGSHRWADLAPYLPSPPAAGVVAQERVLRGEDLRGADLADLPGMEVPLALTDVEPDYPLPVYRSAKAEFPTAEVATRALPAVTGVTGAPRLPDDQGVRALRDLVEVWVAQSAAAVDACVVEGSALLAVGALVPRAALLPVTAGEAFALLQWAGASGGAHGRRRGGAAGRFGTWWAAAALVGLDWPVDPQELDAAVRELHWYRWTTDGAETGWTLRLAVEDPVDGLAWAVDAVDQREDDPLDEG